MDKVRQLQWNKKKKRKRRLLRSDVHFAPKSCDPAELHANCAHWLESARVAYAAKSRGRDPFLAAVTIIAVTSHRVSPLASGDVTESSRTQSDVEKPT